MMGIASGMGNTRAMQFAWLALFAFSLSCIAQKIKVDSISKFRVRPFSSEYQITPADGYLFKSSKNKLKIVNSTKRKFEVKMIGGAIKKCGNDSFFEVDGLTKTGNALLCIYETDARGKKRLVLNKPMSVIPYPKAKFGGVACDSAISALRLATGTFNVHYTGLKIKVPVTSFKMELYEQGKFTLDSSSSNRLSKKMLAYVEKLKPGSIVYLTDIRYKDPNGNEHTERVFRAFIIPDNKILKFGVN